MKVRITKTVMVNGKGAQPGDVVELLTSDAYGLIHRGMAETLEAPVEPIEPFDVTPEDAPEDTPEDMPDVEELEDEPDEGDSEKPKRKYTKRNK